MTTSHSPLPGSTTAAASSPDADGRASRFGVDGTGVATDDDNRSISVDAGSRPPVHARTTRVVVGLDGSPSSLSAFRRAIRVATGMNSTVQGVVAWRVPTSYGTFGVSSWSPESDAEQILADAVADVFGEATPDWFVPTIRQGNPAEILIDESRGAEMLVVGSRGHGGFAGLLLGSVSMACAEHAHCPVLVMHEYDLD